MPSLIKPNAIAMNRILFCLATLVFCLKIPATAQTATAPRSDHPATTTFSRWSLSLETGPAFPVGAFHSIAQISPMAGYARTGYGAELSGNYRICHALGITLAAGFQQNPTATTLLYSEFPGAQGQGPSSVTRQHWSIVRLLAGPSYSIPLLPKKGLSLRFRALAGALKTKIPDVTISTPGPPNSLTTGSTDYFAYGSLHWAFAYQADVALQWNFTRRLALTLDAGYAGSKQEENYTSAEYFSELPPYVGVTTTSYQPGRMTSTVATGALYTRLGIGIGF